MFKTVLFPVDGSPDSREAVSTVANIVKTYQSHLILLSVVQKPSEGENPNAVGMSSPEAVAKLLQGAKALFAGEGIEAEVLEREGKPSFTICDVADEIDANLIVMGCKGTGLTEEGAAESVTNRVINLSPCPVLIVP